ncbi:uncharacterized protein LOC121856381 [Homarus americanus]|uniref:uncharacterized protein LOC121856381 n=1 Tax=Homarus americanus TaxID=6706 RepID=UPI001C437F86|nr:uncharacterized protein LOC121856381 [Homarus americanus]XP_042207860.1 uncharacterized protein LOC121856381 [Homarus americanus]XP_042207861.1 uncharacterized protein LOC121856381 [Homarus americanus]XP_042207863.1 uncharacterized protein LOC121856381 [Homarus americanus]
MQEITNCQVNSPDPLCPDSKTMNEIKESFNLKTKFPPINEWTDSILAQFGGVPMAPVSLVPYFNDQLIKKAKPDIIKIKFDANNYLQCLVWAQALCRVDNCDEMDKETAITWYNSLDGIETCITPSFFDPVVLADDSLTTEGSLKAKLFATVKSMGKMMMARDSYAVQKTVFEGVTGANVTKDVIDGLGGDHMARASACMLQGAAKRTLLKTVLPLMSGSISMAQGSEFPAKVAALMEANMQSALNGNTFTYSNINEALRLHQPQVYS